MPVGAAAVNPTVLVVDADPRELETMRRLLDEDWCTWTVEYADNAASALAILERCAVDVIVADHLMGGADGAEFLAEVRRREPARR